MRRNTHTYKYMGMNNSRRGNGKPPGECEGKKPLKRYSGSGVLSNPVFGCIHKIFQARPQPYDDPMVKKKGRAARSAPPAKSSSYGTK